MSAAAAAYADKLAAVQFEEEGHRYSVGEKYLVGVTSALQGLTDYSMVPPDKLELARQKGVAIHRMVELWCKGDLDLDTLPEWMWPVLATWKKFVADTGFKVIASETLVYHNTFGYAGRLDLFGEFPHGGFFGVVDIKRSFFACKTIGYQTAAYKEAYQLADPRARRARRYALRLADNAPMRIEEYTKLSDFGDFLTCLNYRRLQERSAI